jgi:SAM-dependent methyltransferase
MNDISLAARDRFLAKHPHPDVLTSRACYVCGQGTFEAIADSDRYGIPYPVGICTACGNVQQIKYYNPDILSDFYQNYYRDIYEARTPGHLFDMQVKRNIFEFFDDSVKPSDRVLEIGAGAGGNLVKFKEHGCEVFGLDFDQRYLDEGKKHGIRMEFGSLDNLPPDSQFDIVIIAHVLEHIDGPVEFLRRIGSFLAEQGRVYIEVPSLNQVSEGGYHYDVMTYFQNAHTIHFTTNSFENVCVESGYQIQKSDNFIRAIVKIETGADSTPGKRIKYNYSDSVSLFNKIKTRKNNLFYRNRHKLRSSLISVVTAIGLKAAIKSVLRQGAR